MSDERKFVQERHKNEKILTEENNVSKLKEVSFYVLFTKKNNDIAYIISLISHDVCKVGRNNWLRDDNYNLI